MLKKKRKLILLPSTVNQRPVLEAILADTTCGYSLQFKNLSPDCYISVKHIFNGSAFSWGIITPMSQESYFRGKFNRTRDDYVPFCLWTWLDLYCTSTRNLDAKPYEYAYKIDEMVEVVRQLYQDVVRTVENAVAQWSPDIHISITRPVMFYLFLILVFCRVALATTGCPPQTIDPMYLNADAYQEYACTSPVSYVGVSVAFFYQPQVDIYILLTSTGCALNTPTQWSEGSITSKVYTTVNTGAGSGNYAQNTGTLQTVGNPFILRYGGAGPGGVRSLWPNDEVCVVVNNNSTGFITYHKVNITYDTGIACEGTHLCASAGMTPTATWRDYCCFGPNAVVVYDTTLKRYTCRHAMALCPATTYQWVYKGFTGCSAPCKSPGAPNPINYDYYACVNSFGDTVNGTNCIDAGLGAAPATTSMTCNTQACQWSYAAPRSNCSVTCGTGVISQDYVCVDNTQSNGNGEPIGMVIASSYCTGATCCGGGYFTCDAGICAPPGGWNWTVSAWGPCSTTCGLGHQRRNVTCPAPAGSTTYCPGLPPSNRQTCNPGTCSGTTTTSSTGTLSGAPFTSVPAFFWLTFVSFTTLLYWVVNEFG